MMRAGRRVDVVIPALNEESAIGKVIAAIPAWIDRIVVVDNGSTDRTAEIARQAGALVVHEPQRGYGAACLAGIAQARDADVLVFLDADFSDHPGEMTLLLAPILAGTHDLVIGARVAERGALTPQQRVGNWLACRLMRLIWGARHTDLGPFRAIARGRLEQLEMGDRNFGWTVEMQIKAAARGLAVCEVPVHYRTRIGTSKISGTLKGTVLAACKILCTIGRLAWQTRGQIARREVSTGRP
jgi:glycosyltransferase involved in cell wall biosynthesis